MLAVQTVLWGLPSRSAEAMADTDKVAPGLLLPDKIQPVPADAFFSEKRGNGTASAENK